MTRAPSRRLKTALLTAAAGAMYYSGLIHGLRLLANLVGLDLRPNRGTPHFRLRRGGAIQILIYHRVTDRPDDYLPGIPVSGFSRHMRYVSRYCNPISLADAVSALRAGAAPDNAVVVTFDDGYRDNYLHAFPILRAFEIPATVFVCTGSIGSHEPLWFDDVFRAFAVSRVRRFGNYRLERDTDRAAARSAALKELKRLEPSVRRQRIDEILAELDVSREAPATPLMMSWDEVGELASGGVDIGAHTVSHPVLSRIPVEDARREIVQSKRDVEMRLGLEVRHFAYPNGKRGDYDESTKNLVREAGFLCAVTTNFGSNRCDDPGGPDLYELKRGGPVDESTPLFAAKLNYYRMTS